MTRPADYDPAIDDTPEADAIAALEDPEPPAGYVDRLNAAYDRAHPRRSWWRVAVRAIAGAALIAVLAYLWFR